MSIIGVPSSPLLPKTVGEDQERLTHVVRGRRAGGMSMDRDGASTQTYLTHEQREASCLLLLFPPRRREGT